MSAIHDRTGCIRDFSAEIIKVRSPPRARGSRLILGHASCGVATCVAGCQDRASGSDAEQKARFPAGILLFGLLSGCNLGADKFSSGVCVCSAQKISISPSIFAFPASQKRPDRRRQTRQGGARDRRLRRTKWNPRISFIGNLGKFQDHRGGRWLRHPSRNLPARTAWPRSGSPTSAPSI